MEFTAEQLDRLRKPFDEVGAFEGRSDEETKKILEGLGNYFITLAKINMRIKKEEVIKNEK